MKERPILFSTSMVKAILEGRKTQTRRIIKNQNLGGSPPSSFNAYETECGKFGFESESAVFACPYGQPGDLLYVREEWYPWLNDKGPDGYTRLIRFAADDFCIPVPEDQFDWFEERENLGYHKRPSIHMPKWAARIWLKITNIRVERLQDISEDVNPWVWVVEFERVDHADLIQEAI